MTGGRWIQCLIARGPAMNKSIRKEIASAKHLQINHDRCYNQGHIFDVNIIDFIFGFEYRENFMAKQLLTPIRRQVLRYQMVGLGGHPMKAGSYNNEPHIYGEIGKLLLDKL